MTYSAVSSSTGDNIADGIICLQHGIYHCGAQDKCDPLSLQQNTSQQLSGKACGFLMLLKQYMYVTLHMKCFQETHGSLKPKLLYYEGLLVKTSTHQNVDNQNVDRPKRRQTETSTSRNVDKPKRSQTKTSTSRNVDKPKRRQAETSTNQNVDKPKRRQVETSTNRNVDILKLQHNSLDIMYVLSVHIQNGTVIHEITT